MTRNSELNQQPSGVPRVLALLPYPPSPLRPRSVSALKNLSAFSQVDLIYLDHGDSAKVPVNVQSIKTFPNRMLHRVVRIGFGSLVGKPILYQYYYSRALRRHLQRMDLSVYAAVYVEKLPLQELRLKHPNIILDIADCNSSIAQQFRKHTRGTRWLLSYLDTLVLPKYEAELCNRAAAVICTAEREAAAFRAIGVRRPIIVMAHDSNALEFRRREIKDTTPRILSFHGKLTYVANRLAVEQLGRAVAPQLDPTRYKLLIAGAGSEGLRRKYPKLTFTGYLEDIVSHLRSVHLSIFPVELSAGLANKAFESLAAGVPIIVTPQLAAGLPDSEALLENGIFVRKIGDFVKSIEEYFALPLSRQQSISDSCVDYVKNMQDPAPRIRLLERLVTDQSQHNQELGDREQPH